MRFVRVSGLAALAAGLRPRPRRGVRRGRAEKGKTAFVQHGCWQCHGFQGQGGRHRPASWRPILCRCETFTAFVRDLESRHAAV